MSQEVDRLAPSDYRRIPWKNGGGELVVIADGGGSGWDAGGVPWHFGRTSIVAPGPFSDLTGFERLQVVIKGRGLVLVTPDAEIDLREPFLARRYDGGTPIVTRLEAGPVEVVNLIAERNGHDIDLRVGTGGAELTMRAGEHIVHAPTGAASVAVDGRTYALAEDHALRVPVDGLAVLRVGSGRVLVGSIYPKSP